MNGKKTRIEQWSVLFPACLLAGAATLKIADTTIFGMDNEGSLLFRFVLPFAEYLVSAWLVSGLLSRWAKLTASALFIFFLIVALGQVFLERSSCGCFGVLTMHPKFVVAIDLVSIICLVVWNPLANLRILRFAPLIVALALGLACMWIESEASGLSESPDSKWTILDPEEWVGTDFPEIANFDYPNNFRNGNWKVLFFASSCPDCRRLIDELHQNTKEKILFVRIPPHNRLLPSDSSGKFWRELSDDKVWIASLPILLNVAEGVVVDQLRKK